jgi:pimeloyl-ACP methyl ester carboxylesterase
LLRQRLRQRKRGYHIIRWIYFVRVSTVAQLLEFRLKNGHSKMAAQGHAIVDVAYRLAPETDIIGMVNDDHQINTKNKVVMLFLTIVLLGAIVLGILFLIPGFTFSIKDKQGHDVDRSIASLEKVNLGGQEQWILLRGMDITKPVILFLHGGPGTSNMCLLRKYTDELEQHFIVVTWDQRGAGKSYKAINPHSSMTIDRFVLDTGELTQLLCHRFDRQKIFLVGHSWGSLIGIFSIQKYPDLYHAYIGIGQIVNMQENEQISYDWTLAQATKAEDKRAIRTLTEIGTPAYTGDGQKKLMTQRRLLNN